MKESGNRKLNDRCQILLLNVFFLVPFSLTFLDFNSRSVILPSVFFRVELFTLLFPNTQLPSILEYLDINRTGTFFHLAVANGYSKIVDSILHRNPVLVHRHDPYSKMYNMRLAVEGGHKTMIEVLVKHGLLPPVLEIEEDAGREEETEDE